MEASGRVPDLDVVHDLEPGVCEDPGLEELGEAAVVPDVVLQAGHLGGEWQEQGATETAHPVVSDDKPELEGTEAATEWNPPVL